jgi:hypothetical protein
MTVKTKKMPDLKQAGTGKSRRDREVAVMKMLDEIRERDLVAFQRQMQLLASLAKNKSR